jgi:hypothetical protein
MMIHVAIFFQFHTADLIVNIKIYVALFALTLSITTAVMAIKEIFKYCSSAAHFHTPRKY